MKSLSLEVPTSLRTATLASVAVTLWLAGRSVGTALFAAWLTGGTTGVGAGAPTGLMLKSVLMAASWPPSSQIPTPLHRQLCPGSPQLFVRECGECAPAIGVRI